MDYKDKILTSVKKVAPFIRWYVDTKPKDRTKTNYDKDIKGTCSTEFETVMKDWLIRSDVQESILEYMKAQKFIKIINIYESMCEKATNGDSNAAKFVIEFSKGDFFSSDVDEADTYLEGIDIPMLKGGK